MSTVSDVGVARPRRGRSWAKPGLKESFDILGTMLYSLSCQTKTALSSQISADEDEGNSDRLPGNQRRLPEVTLLSISQHSFHANALMWQKMMHHAFMQPCTPHAKNKSHLAIQVWVKPPVSQAGSRPGSTVGYVGIANFRQHRKAPQYSSPNKRLQNNNYLDVRYLDHPSIKDRISKSGLRHRSGQKMAAFDLSHCTLLLLFENATPRVLCF